MKTGLLGAKLGHSFSPRIHAELGNSNYELFEIQEKDLPAFLSRADLHALNVTIPYKETVIPFLNSLTPQARAIGAVNTLVRQKDGSWLGDNTDYDGVCTLLDAANIDVTGRKCLILGGGGTAKTVHTVLQDRNAREILHIVRHDGIPYSDLPLHRDADILINTTPVGMHPNCPSRLLDLDLFDSLEGVCDVIYNPLRTLLLLDAAERGIPAAGGLIMLVAQAVAADARFFGKKLDFSRVTEITHMLQCEQENILLIGMPGVGKTTVGKYLADMLQRPFIDLDESFNQRWGDTAAFIRKHGETAFRENESILAREAGRLHGHVIACGGGIVTVPDNYAALKENGRIYLLTRDLASLETDGRPLSDGGIEGLKTLYAKRRTAYERFADVTIENTTPKEAAATIKEDFYEDSRFKRA